MSSSITRVPILEEEFSNRREVIPLLPSANPQLSSPSPRSVVGAGFFLIIVLFRPSTNLGFRLLSTTSVTYYGGSTMSSPRPFSCVSTFQPYFPMNKVSSWPSDRDNRRVYLVFTTLGSLETFLSLMSFLQVDGSLSVECAPLFPLGVVTDERGTWSGFGFSFSSFLPIS